MPHIPPSPLPRPSTKNRTHARKTFAIHATSKSSVHRGDQESDTEDISAFQDYSCVSSNDSGLEDDESAVDAPRIAQWEDDQDFEEVGESSQGPARIRALQDDLSSLPLGTLRKAQSVLTPAIGVFDEVDYSDGSMKLDGLHREGDGSKMIKHEWSLKPRSDIAKRTSKNAPIEITSKRPVTRKRTVVEVKQVQARDPRFLPLAGEFSGDKYQQHYSFLAESHKTELMTLQTNLKRARKLLVSSPQDLLPERHQEVKRLELATKRAESIVNSDRRIKVEREALFKVSREERSKRKGGKTGWWLKESEKREVLVRARYDALVAEGGNKAVKKAIGKKQKKLGQRAKKTRPFEKEGSAGLRQKRGLPSDGQEEGWLGEKMKRPRFQ